MQGSVEGFIKGALKGPSYASSFENPVLNKRQKPLQLSQESKQVSLQNSVGGIIYEQSSQQSLEQDKLHLKVRKAKFNPNPAIKQRQFQKTILDKNFTSKMKKVPRQERLSRKKSKPGIRAGQLKESLDLTGSADSKDIDNSKINIQGNTSFDSSHSPKAVIPEVTPLKVPLQPIEMVSISQDKYALDSTESRAKKRGVSQHMIKRNRKLSVRDQIGRQADALPKVKTPLIGQRQVQGGGMSTIQVHDMLRVQDMKRREQAKSAYALSKTRKVGGGFATYNPTSLGQTQLTSIDSKFSKVSSHTKTTSHGRSRSQYQNSGMLPKYLREGGSGRENSAEGRRTNYSLESEFKVHSTTKGQNLNDINYGYFFQVKTPKKGVRGQGNRKYKARQVAELGRQDQVSESPFSYNNRANTGSINTNEMSGGDRKQVEVMKEKEGKVLIEEQQQMVQNIDTGSPPRRLLGNGEDTGRAESPHFNQTGSGHKQQKANYITIDTNILQKFNKKSKIPNKHAPKKSKFYQTQSKSIQPSFLKPDGARISHTGNLANPIFKNQILSNLSSDLTQTMRGHLIMQSKTLGAQFKTSSVNHQKKIPTISLIPLDEKVSSGYGQSSKDTLGPQQREEESIGVEQESFNVELVQRQEQSSTDTGPFVEAETEGGTVEIEVNDQDHQGSVQLVQSEKRSGSCEVQSQTPDYEAKQPVSCGLELHSIKDMGHHRKVLGSQELTYRRTKSTQRGIIPVQIPTNQTYQIQEYSQSTSDANYDHEHFGQNPRYIQSRSTRRPRTQHLHHEIIGGGKTINIQDEISEIGDTRLLSTQVCLVENDQDRSGPHSQSPQPVLTGGIQIINAPHRNEAMHKLMPISTISYSHTRRIKHLKAYLRNKYRSEMGDGDGKRQKSDISLQPFRMSKQINADLKSDIVQKGQVSRTKSQGRVPYDRGVLNMTYNHNQTLDYQYQQLRGSTKRQIVNSQTPIKTTLSQRRNTSPLQDTQSNNSSAFKQYSSFRETGVLKPMNLNPKNLLTPLSSNTHSQYGGGHLLSEKGDMINEDLRGSLTPKKGQEQIVYQLIAGGPQIGHIQSNSHSPAGTKFDQIPQFGSLPVRELLKPQSRQGPNRQRIQLSGGMQVEAINDIQTFGENSQATLGITNTKDGSNIIYRVSKQNSKHNSNLGSRRQSNTLEVKTKNDSRQSKDHGKEGMKSIYTNLSPKQMYLLQEAKMAFNDCRMSHKSQDDPDERPQHVPPKTAPAHLQKRQIPTKPDDNQQPEMMQYSSRMQESSKSSPAKLHIKSKQVHSPTSTQKPILEEQQAYEMEQKQVPNVIRDQNGLPKCQIPISTAYQNTERSHMSQINDQKSLDYFNIKKTKGIVNDDGPQTIRDSAYKAGQSQMESQSRTSTINNVQPTPPVVRARTSQEICDKTSDREQTKSPGCNLLVGSDLVSPTAAVHEQPIQQHQQDWGQGIVVNGSGEYVDGGWNNEIPYVDIEELLFQKTQISGQRRNPVLSFKNPRCKTNYQRRRQKSPIIPSLLQKNEPALVSDLRSLIHEKDIRVQKNLVGKKPGRIGRAMKKPKMTQDALGMRQVPGTMNMLINNKIIIDKQKEVIQRQIHQAIRDYEMSPDKTSSSPSTSVNRLQHRIDLKNSFLQSINKFDSSTYESCKSRSKSISYSQEFTKKINSRVDKKKIIIELNPTKTGKDPKASVGINKDSPQKIDIGRKKQQFLSQQLSRSFDTTYSKQNDSKLSNYS